MLDLKQYATLDFQNRGKNSPQSGKPVSIECSSNRLAFDFHNTSEKDAKKFVGKFCKKIGHCEIDAFKEGDSVIVYAAFNS